jgi:hypothetical protein
MSAAVAENSLKKLNSILEFTKKVKKRLKKCFKFLFEFRYKLDRPNLPELSKTKKCGSRAQLRRQAARGRQHHGAARGEGAVATTNVCMNDGTDI